jgi:ABC-type nitrate/sulfonate/bicarbonate transport system permease component
MQQRAGVIHTLVGSLAALVVLTVLWALYAHSGELNNLYFAAPETVLARFVTLSSSGALQTHVMATFVPLLSGLLGAAVAGLTFGIALGLNAQLRFVLGPMVSVLAAAPLIAAAPLLMTWYGIGSAAKATSVFLVAAFPIANTAMLAIAAPRPAGTAGAPSSTPRIIGAILSALRLGIGFAAAAIIVSEVVGSQAGLGFLILQGAMSFDVALMLTASIVLAVPVIAVTIALQAIEVATAG